MKIINRIIYCLIIVNILSSCVKDEGNYDYKILPGVDFSNMPTEQYAIIGTSLIINGDIETDIPEEDISYAWYIPEYENGGWQGDTISTEQDLSVITSYDQGTLNLIFSVYDKLNDVRYNKSIDLHVVTPFSQGWAILKDKDGIAEFDFISEITEDHIVDVFETVAGVTLSGTPINIGLNWKTSTGWSELYVCTSEGGARFDATIMKLESYFIDHFSTTDHLESPFTNVAIDYYADSYGWPLIAGGKVYAKNGTYLEDGWYEYPSAGDYYVSDKSAWALGNVVFFDDLNQRYISYVVNGYTIDCYNLTSVVSSDADTALFDPSNVGMDCIWMETEGTSYNIVSVLKDADQNYFLQRFLLSSATFTANAHINLENGLVDDNSQFANDNVYSFTYMSQGNRIHRYNRESDIIDPDYLSATGEITAMEVHKEGAILAIVYDNANGGSTIELLDMLNDGVSIATYDIDSKIIELEHKLDS